MIYLKNARNNSWIVKSYKRTNSEYFMHNMYVYILYTNIYIYMRLKLIYNYTFKLIYFFIHLVKMGNKPYPYKKNIFIYYLTWHNLFF